jgi:hypothetical protein
MHRRHRHRSAASGRRVRLFRQTTPAQHFLRRWPTTVAAAWPVREPAAVRLEEQFPEAVEAEPVAEAEGEAMP